MRIFFNKIIALLILIPNVPFIFLTLVYNMFVVISEFKKDEITLHEIEELGKKRSEEFYTYKLAIFIAVVFYLFILIKIL